MKIVLLGPPGSGKGTQTQFITNEYNIKKISVGDILRKSKKNKFFNKIKTTMNQGKLISDQLIIKIIKKIIENESFNQGFLLDGFPRTITQAIALKKMQTNINYVLELLISNETIINRLNGRLVHLPSGRIYHKKYKPPKIKYKDDITGEELIFRQDDQKKTIKNRLIEYNKFITPIVFFYQQEAKLNNLEYYKINANDTIININKKIKRILG